MSNLFAAKREDGKAEWRVAYELALPLDIGEVLTFDALCDELGYDRGGDLHSVYTAVGRANHELRLHNQRSLENVMKVGYRVLHPTEHELQARRFQKASRRKMSTGVEVIKAVDLSLLSEVEKQRTIALSMVLQGMVQAMGEIDRRQERTERLLLTMAQQTEERLVTAESQMSQMAEAMKAAGLLP